MDTIMKGACLLISCIVTSNFTPWNVDAQCAPNVIKLSPIYCFERPPWSCATLTMTIVILCVVYPSTTFYMVSIIWIHFQSLMTQPWTLIHDWQSTSSLDKLKNVAIWMISFVLCNTTCSMHCSISHPLLSLQWRCGLFFSVKFWDNTYICL